MPCHDKKAFIPYDGIIRKVPAGIFKCIHGEATDITASEILLDTGEKVDYSYLAIATGVSQPFPAKVLATDREKACGELRTMQEAIKSANNIAIVGGGAVGVEIAMDIKSFNPEKQVTLVHSRKQLLPRFGSKLHDYAFDALKKQGVKVILQERPQIVAADAEGQAGSDSDKKALRFSDGRVEAFDLVVSRIMVFSFLKATALLISNRNTDPMYWLQPKLEDPSKISSKRPFQGNKSNSRQRYSSDC